MASRKRILESSQRDCKKLKADNKSGEDDFTVLNERHNLSNDKSKGYFADLSVFIHPAGIEKARFTIFKNQIYKNGGLIHEKYDSAANLTHIIVDDKMDISRLLRLMQLDIPPDIPIVKSAWLSLCVKNKEVIPTDNYTLCIPSSTAISTKASESVVETQPVSIGVNSVHSKGMFAKGGKIHFYETKASYQERSSGGSKVMFAKGGKIHFQPKKVRANSGSDYEPSDDDKDESIATSTIPSMTPQKQLPVEKWICAQSSKNPKPNLNKHITEKLEEMVKIYESTNDKWRAFGYQKAIQAICRHPKEISSWEEAKSLPGVGRRLADKIWEIAQSGELTKLKELESSEKVHILKLFTDVWGAGPHTAQSWYQQGFRTIADLKEKGHLTHQQEVGVRLYEDLLDRMPREEAAEIEQVVREAAENIEDGIIAQACGSYRRGKPTCGDVDILITHPDGKSHQGMFHKLLTRLKESGFLTDDLVSTEEKGNQKKYLGVCKLPGENRKHRRLDIIVVPYEEYGCALVYFTGSAHFNRSLRHLCKKQNMSLNEHTLKTGVVRKGTEKIYEGTVITTPTEESVFQVLNIPYRPPEERDH